MSTIKVDTIKTTSNVEVFTCKAWVNFDGTTNTGGTCTIRASGNVTSVTDHSTGSYTINFTTAMPDANYSGSVTAGDITNGRQSGWEYISSGPALTRTTSSYRVATGATATPGVSATSYYDVISINVAVFR